jgi:PiT family inorganic phosphate transporter
MLILLALVASGLFLAYNNGANDNFKGVATLYGSGTVNYKTAITIATVATFAGFLSSIYLAENLLTHFSGKGLVPDEFVSSPSFLLSVSLGAGLTVFLATRLGFPISTTHSLIGALVGSGLMAAGSAVDLSILGNRFFLPLLASPIIALLLGATTYIIFRWFGKKYQPGKELCFCRNEMATVIPAGIPNTILARQISALTRFQLAATSDCDDQYSDVIFKISPQTILDWAHGLSATIVCFARGLNDTPKIMGLLLIVSALDVQLGLFAIGLGMAIGGLFGARRVAETVGHKITSMNHSQGFSANLVTGMLVIFASKLGMPVSTTHVSIGAIFGIGLINRQGERSMMKKIALSWLVTLPVAATIAATLFALAFTQ